MTRSAIHAQVERPLSDELSTGKDVLPLDVALQYAYVVAYSDILLDPHQGPSKASAQELMPLSCR